MMIDATDAAIELAEKHGIDLAGLDGTGADGRILVSDVEAVVEAGQAQKLGHALPDRPGEEHNELTSRAILPLQAINGVSPAWPATPVAGVEKFAFANQGGLVTFLVAAGGWGPSVPSAKPLTVGVRGREEEDDLIAVIQPGEAAYIGPFPPGLYNRVDQLVWLDVAGEGNIAVLRVGV